MDWVKAWDQFGVRSMKYPVAFTVDAEHLKRLKALLKDEGWFEIHHKDAAAAYQAEAPLIPHLDGFAGRRHVAIFCTRRQPLEYSVTAHVDKNIATGHDMDAMDTARFVREFRAYYEPRTREPTTNPKAPKILLDLHSYPPDTPSEYRPYDMVLLRVRDVTDDRFYAALRERLAVGGYKVGILPASRTRADLITQAKKRYPKVQALLLETNEKYENDLATLGRHQAAAILDTLRAAGATENLGVVGTAAAHALTSLVGMGVYDALRPKANPLDAADERYHKFHAFEPAGRFNATIPDPKPPVAIVGKLSHVVYWCSKWKREGVRYIHRWKRALMLVGQDRRGTYWFIGKCSVQPEGITDYGHRVTWREGDRYDLTVPKTVVYLGILEEIAIDGRPVPLKHCALCTNAAGSRLFIVPLDRGQKPSHPARYRPA